MALNEDKLKDLLHGLVMWLPVTSESISSEFHSLIDDVDDSVENAEPEPEPTPIGSSAPVPSSTSTPSSVSDAPTANEIAAAVAGELAPALNAIAEALSKPTPSSSGTEIPVGVPGA